MLHGQAAYQVGQAVTRALDFLTGKQLPGGGFLSYLSTRPDGFTRLKPCRTTFFPSIILGALASTADPAGGPLKHRIVEFLIAERSEAGSFNYWDRQGPQAALVPYPDDLDDTFCALSALYRYDPRLIDGEMSAQLAKMLITTETIAGGPYRTWLVGETNDARWLDVDVAVNANVAAFLALQEVTLPNLSHFIEQAIDNDRIDSPYYADHYPIIYFISSWYRGERGADLQRLLLDDRHEGHWPDALRSALALTALLRLDYPADDLEPAARYVLAEQQKDGSWPAAAFSIDTVKQGVTTYAGCSELTTALCLEALECFQKKSMTIQVKKNEADPRYSGTKAQVARVINSLESPELRRSARAVLRRLVRQDNDKQIILLPWLIAAAVDRQVEDLTLRLLAAASLWGWMAYTVYDDFLDGEGQPQYLPAANLCLRNLTMTLRQTMPANEAFHAECQSILDRLDAANAWEIAHCRGTVTSGVLRIKRLPDYGDYWQLADRSLGHTIAGLGVLYATDASARSLDAMRDFFTHYLIARQLNDDAHDWQDDLAAGHINAAGVEVLKLWQAGGHGTVRKGIDLAAETDGLRLIMWEQVIPGICEQVFAHGQLARKALEGLHSTQADQLEVLLIPHEQAARQALDSRQDTLDFIRALA